jgi:aminoglycoside phosphotransferase family enzyme
MCKLQAIQFNGQNADEILDFIGRDNAFHNRSNGLWVFLPHGHKRVHVDDYVLLSEDKTIRVYDLVEFNKDFEPVP